MAELLTELKNEVLYFHDMGPILISAEAGQSVDISLESNRAGLLLEESYYPGFDGVISLDISDTVATCLHPIIPEMYSDTPQNDLYDNFTLKYGDKSVEFAICGCSEDIKTRITDIDTLCVPKDYQLPLSLCNNCVREGITFCFPDGTSGYEPGLETIESVGVVSRMINIEHSPAVGHNSFYINLDCGENTIVSPVFRITAGNYEQYLFANRYGGFDNIPMNGTLEFTPEFQFESGVFNNSSEQLHAEADYAYVQNSGFLSRKVMELASELLCSSEIYHIASNGEYRKIIILESNLTNKSTNSLHSFTFKYKYADDTRPASLRSRSVGSYIHSANAGAPTKTQVHSITNSPMTITHNLGRFPSVAVIDDNKQVVLTSVEYKDSNSIIISWNGELKGFVYIN